MIYSALCIDNTNYFNSGTITVRIFNYYNAPSIIGGKKNPIDDLSANLELEKEGGKNPVNPKIKEDFEALVFAPLGGGRNYGMFYLPQINSKGIVSFLDGSFEKPVWLGSYFEPLTDDKWNIKGVNIPSDQTDREGVDKDGAFGGEQIDGDERTIILRTKHTEGGDKDTLNWEKVNTENLVAIDNNQVRIRHFTSWDSNTAKKYQDILIHKNGSDKEEIKLEVTNLTDDKTGTLTLTDEGFKIEIVEGSDTSTFEFANSDNAINFSDKFGNQILGNSTGIQIYVSSGNEIHLIGDDDTIVKYTDLKEIVEKLCRHIHVSTVPTTPPLDASLAPLEAQLVTNKINMEATRTKTS